MANLKLISLIELSWIKFWIFQILHFFEKCTDTNFYTEFEKKIKDIFGEDSIKIIFGLDHPDDVCIGYFVIKLLDNLKEHKTQKTNQLISEIEKKYGKQYFEDQSPD